MVTPQWWLYCLFCCYPWGYDHVCGKPIKHWRIPLVTLSCVAIPTHTDEEVSIIIFSCTSASHVSCLRQLSKHCHFFLIPNVFNKLAGEHEELQISTTEVSLRDFSKHFSEWSSPKESVKYWRILREVKFHQWCDWSCTTVGACQEQK